MDFRRGAAGTPTSTVTDSAMSADEKLTHMCEAVTTLLRCMGEDPSREGLVNTPMRMAKALLALTSGYGSDPTHVVGDALFECDSDEMVLVRDIELYSLCEHHVLPFFGRAHVAYIPNGRVVGLSKVARLVNTFARRLQIQERLTQEIAHALQTCVGAKGVAVMIDCAHMCMAMRGVEKRSASTVTTCFLGAFKEDKGLRAEFCAQARGVGSAGAAGIY